MRSRSCALGTLKADIRSTDGLRLPLRFEQQGTVHTLHFTAIREGKYDITVTYDGNPLPNMPIRAVTSSTTVNNNASDHLKVEVQGRGSYEAKVNEEAEFIVDASKTLTYGAGMPVVRLTGVQKRYRSANSTDRNERVSLFVHSNSTR